MFHCTLLIIQGVLEGSECQCEWSLPPASSAKEATISAAFTHLNHLGHVFDLLVVCSSNTFLTVPITQSGKNQREGENMYQVMSFSNAINMDTGAYHLERLRYPSVRCSAKHAAPKSILSSVIRLALCNPIPIIRYHYLRSSSISAPGLYPCAASTSSTTSPRTTSTKPISQQPINTPPSQDPHLQNPPPAPAAPDQGTPQSHHPFPSDHPSDPAEYASPAPQLQTSCLPREPH